MNKIKDYFKSFKVLVPTWVIFLLIIFHDEYGITSIIGVTLFVFQAKQLRKIKNEIVKENIEIKDENPKIKVKTDTLESKIENREASLEKLRLELKSENERADSFLSIINKQNSELETAQKYKDAFTEANLNATYLKKELEQQKNIQNKLQDTISNNNDEIKKLKSYLRNSEEKSRNLKLSLDDCQKENRSLSEIIQNKISITKENNKKINELKGRINNLESSLEIKNKKIENQKVELNKKNRITEESLSIQKELAIINNNLVDKYYIFSDYDGISSEDCKNKLLLLKQEERELRTNEYDVNIYSDEAYSNKKMHVRLVRQILRIFNSECDNIILNIKNKNIDACRKKIQQSYNTINELFSLDEIEITSDLLELKLEQATLLYTYELKYRQEKEIQRAIKEEMIQQAKEREELDRRQKQIDKDLQQHIGEQRRMLKYMQKTRFDAEKQVYIDKIKELEEKIKILRGDKEKVSEREANARAGYVYIISNIGSFGDNIYKIGVTRRLEPMERIRELSSASVPFEFDVHAMIFSSDAYELETSLHKHFADRAVNKVNPRKEFFNVNIDEIEKVVKENYNDAVQFIKIPVATEYWQSMNM